MPQVAHIKLSYSRAFLVRAYLLQPHEMLFDAHRHGLRVFEGVPSRGIDDNMKTAVDRVGVGKKRDVNARFRAMTSYYWNSWAGWEKDLLIRMCAMPATGSGSVCQPIPI
jgi:hypothetical protein